MSAIAYTCPDFYHLVPSGEGSLPCPSCGLRWTHAPAEPVPADLLRPPVVVKIKRGAR